MATDVDAFDHDAHMRRAFEQARIAIDRGDEPFGSVLVRDDAVLMAASNRVVTEDDIRRHPELDLAAHACRELPPAARSETVMYTSTEPCLMCAGGLVRAGFARVAYSVGSDEVAEFVGRAPAVRSAEILDGVTEVVGPVLNEAGREIHREYGW